MPVVIANRFSLLMLLCLATLTLGHTSFSPLSCIPLAFESNGTVPAFNAWTIGWNATSATFGFTNYWQAPIFAPNSVSFALCETQPLTIIVAPLVWWVSPAVAYNVYLLLSLTLNGWFGNALLKQMGFDDQCALMGGALCLCLPFCHWRLGVLQLVPIWGILWLLLALVRYSESPKWTIAIETGVAAAATYHLCNYYGLFTALAMVVVVPAIVINKVPIRKILGDAALALFVTGLLVAPIVLKQREVLQQPAYERDAELLENLSAELGDFLVSPFERLPFGTYGPWFAKHRWMNWKLGVGSLWTTTAAAGLCLGFIYRKSQRLTALACLLVLIGLLGSCAMNIRMGNWIPFETMRQWVPGLGLIRSPYRFAVFFQIGMVILATQCLQSLRQSSTAWIKQWGASAVIGMILFQIFPCVTAVHRCPQFQENANWINCLKSTTTADDIIIHLPFVPGRTADDYLPTVEWMYAGLWHGRPLVNGYAGYFPATHNRLRTGLVKDPETSLQQMIDYGADVIIIKQEVDDLHLQVDFKHLQKISGDASSPYHIYRIQRSDHPPE